MTGTYYPNPLTSSFLDAAIQELPEDYYVKQGYIGRKLLPLRVLRDRKVLWEVTQFENALAGIYGEGTRPVSGSGTLPWEMKWAQLVHLMASETIDPNSVKQFRKAGESAIYTNPLAKDAYTELVGKVSEAQREIDHKIESLIEYLCIGALTGEINWPPPNIEAENWQPEWGNIQISQETLGFNAKLIQDATTLAGVTRDGEQRTGAQVSWKDTSADPILDLEVIADLMLNETGVSPRGGLIVCSSSVPSFLTRNENIIQYLGAGKDFAPRRVAWAAVEEWVKTQFGYDWLLYDNMYTYRTMADLGSEDFRSVNSARFLPEGKMVILPPEAAMGGQSFGYLGTTETRVQGGYKSGKYTYVVEDNEPPNEIRIGEGGLFWPVIQRPDRIFVFDAWS